MPREAPFWLQFYKLHVSYCVESSLKVGKLLLSVRNSYSSPCQLRSQPDIYDMLCSTKCQLFNNALFRSHCRYLRFSLISPRFLVRLSVSRYVRDVPHSLKYGVGTNTFPWARALSLRNRLIPATFWLTDDRETFAKFAGSPFIKIYSRLFHNGWLRIVIELEGPVRAFPRRISNSSNYDCHFLDTC